jgi:hypothetical protein
MKQTAVEWLVEEFKEKLTGNNLPNWVLDVIQQAKEMEKEQIRIAYMEGAFEKMRHLEGKEFMMPTEYYNETYESE